MDACGPAVLAGSVSVGARQHPGAYTLRPSGLEACWLPRHPRQTQHLISEQPAGGDVDGAFGVSPGKGQPGERTLPVLNSY